MSQKNVLIVGSGAMATLFATRLSRVANISLYGTWESGLQAIESEGVRVVESDGSETSASIGVERQVEQLPKIQAALVLVKSWQTEQAAQALAQCLGAEGIALSLQNGLGNLEILKETLGDDRAALGVTTTGATLLAPGVVRHGGDGPIYLGSHPRVELLADLLVLAGFELQVQEDLNGLIWTKLGVNAAINPLTALLEIRNGRLLEQPSCKELMGAAAQEVAVVARALGIHLAREDLTIFAMEVAERTRTNISSMLQDIRRGAPTEIDAICGAIVRIAMEQNLEVPINRVLWNLVRTKAGLQREE